MDIVGISENCIKYIPSDNPNNSFTMTYRSYTNPSNSKSTTYLNENIDSPDIESWTYRPTDNNPQYIKGKEAVSCIKRIAQKLPKINLPMLKDNSDYPIINNSAFGMVGVDYHLEREVFALGSTIFFRRYNDDWCDTLICGFKTNNDLVSYHKDLHYEFVFGLEKLLENKNYLLIDLEDINKISN